MVVVFKELKDIVEKTAAIVVSAAIFSIIGLKTARFVSTKSNLSNLTLAS